MAPVIVVAAISVIVLRPAPGVSAPADGAAPVSKKKRKRRAAAGLRRPVPNPVYRYLFAPLAAVGFLFFLVAPFDVASTSSFYVGASSVAESLRSLASAFVGPWRLLARQPFRESGD